MNIRRMARWLAYFEPDYCKISRLTTNFVLETIDFFVLGTLELSNNQAIITVFPTQGLRVEQGKLFEMCARAAIARGWYPAISYGSDEQWTAEITSDGSGDVLAQVETAAVDQFGLAMAQALIETRETNWQSRDPEAQP